jgi:hypothetical protein
MLEAVMSKHLNEFLAAEFQITVRTVHPDSGGEFLYISKRSPA